MGIIRIEVLPSRCAPSFVLPELGIQKDAGMQRKAVEANRGRDWGTSEISSK